MNNIKMLLAVVILMFAACNDGNQNNPDTISGTDNSTDNFSVADFGDIPVMDINLTGRLNGVSCTQSKQCKYETCYNSPNITGSVFMFCTKNCTDTNLGTCGDDDANGIHYTAVRWGSLHPKESLTCICVPSCTNVNDCKAIDPRYNACKNPGTGARNVCMYQRAK